MVLLVLTVLSSGHNYVLQRNEVVAYGYRMSWDRAWLRLQEFRVNIYSKDKAMAAAASLGIVSHKISYASGSDASSWG